MDKINFSSFSGGICDHYVNAPLDRAKTMENFSILTNETTKTRPGRRLDSTSDSQIPSGNVRVSALINYDSNRKYFVLAARRLFYRDPTSWSEVVGNTSNSFLPTAGSSDFPSFSEWRRQTVVTNEGRIIPQILFLNGSSAYDCLTVGLPALATEPSLSSAGGSGHTYIYAFHYYYEYTVVNEVFAFRGPITYKTISNVGEPHVHTVTINALPAISNGSTLNYATSGSAKVKIKIYRTTDAGQVFYFVKEVDHDVGSTTDTANDTTLDDSSTIYTTGDIVEDEQPPECSYVHIVDNTGYYCNFTDGTSGDVIENGFRVSIKGRPFSVPADNEDRVDEEIVGVSSTNSIPIIFQKNKISRVEGGFDLFGNGNVVTKVLDSNAGCLSHRGIVQAQQSVFWLGNDGIYFSDGYKVLKVSRHLNETYKLWKQGNAEPKKISGVYDSSDDTIKWSIQRELSGDNENDTIVVLELGYGVSEEMPVHIWTGQDGSGFFPTTLMMFDDVLYTGDKYGYVLSFDPENISDQAVDSSLSSSDWKDSTVIWDLVSVATDMGLPYTTKWVTRCFFEAKNLGNVSVQMRVINDDGRIVRTLTPIRATGFFEWGDEGFVWGSTLCVWGAGGNIAQWRRLPRNGLRLVYLQFQITNAFVVIYGSDLKGDATVDPNTDTVTLDVGEEWSPSETIRDYYISFSEDEYVKEYKITDRLSAQVIEVEDIANTLPTGSYQWLVKGYKKGEMLNMTGVTFKAAARGDGNLKTFDSSQTGENAV